MDPLVETVVYSTAENIESGYGETVVEVTRIGETDQYVYRKGVRSFCCKLPLHKCTDDDNYDYEVTVKQPFTSLYPDLPDLYDSLKKLAAERRMDKEMIEMFTQ